MPRYALKLEYHGGPFSGWQKQRDHPSVQAALETALRRLEPDMAGIAAAGRTDAGVHALGQVWRVRRVLDAEAMQVAARHFLGTHDFTTFRAALCQAKSPVKTVDAVEISVVAAPAGTEIIIDVRARSFLHNQVRSFVGTLERVGAGAWDPGDVKLALEARDRAACGPVAPPDGLYLVGVDYPVDPFAG